MRPMVMNRESSHIDFSNTNKDDMACESQQVLGDGIYDDICDVEVK